MYVDDAVCFQYRGRNCIGSPVLFRDQFMLWQFEEIILDDICSFGDIYPEVFIGLNVLG